MATGFHAAAHLPTLVTAFPYLDIGVMAKLGAPRI
jgi:hypothetical protein